jgi:hypothetical protein
LRPSLPFIARGNFVASVICVHAYALPNAIMRAALDDGGRETSTDHPRHSATRHASERPREQAQSRTTRHRPK